MSGDAPSWSLNSITVRQLNLPQLLLAAQQHGYQAIGIWRDLFAEYPPFLAARLVEHSGLRVSSVCRAGLFTHADPAARRQAIEDSLAAVEQAATMRAAALVVVPGGLIGRDLAGSRSMVRDGLGAITDAAAQAGVRLALEPMHPILVQERSCITSLGEALDLIDELGSPALGIAYDAYHLWWDSALPTLAPRLTGRIDSVQIGDWLPPDHGVTSSRGVPGEGCIDLPGFIAGALTTGYTGDIEIEVLSQPWWTAGPEATLKAVARGLAHF